MVSTVWRKRHEYSVAQVDVFSGNSFVWAEAACAVLKLLGKPFVLTLHGGMLPEFAVQHPARVRRLLQAAAAVTAPSEFLRQSLSNFRPDIMVIPNGVDIDRYPFHLKARGDGRLLWLRALENTYNPTLAVEVLASLASDYSKLQLIMVGPDKDGSLSKLKDLACQLGVSNQVEFPGQVPKEDVPLWMARGDVFLNTTNVDNTPVSVIEAMACGVPVVSTAVGGIPFLIQDGVDGLLVPPRDSVAMVAAVRKLLVKPDFAEQLSGAARDKVEAWSWQMILPQWEALFQKVTLRHEAVHGRN